MRKSLILIAFNMFLVISPFFSDETKIKIAVFDLEVTSRDVLKSEGITLSDYIRSSFIKTGSFDVITRNKLKRVIEEYKFQLAGLTEGPEAIRLGKILNIKKAIVGSLGKFGNTYIINIQLLNLETGKYITAESIEAESMDEALQQVNEKVNIISQEAERQESQVEIEYSNGKYVGQVIKSGKKTLRHGYGTLYHDNGDKYIGNWIDDKRSGYGIYCFANGDRYEGEFQEDQPSGGWYYSSYSGTKAWAYLNNGGIWVYKDTTSQNTTSQTKTKKKELFYTFTLLGFLGGAIYGYTNPGSMNQFESALGAGCIFALGGLLIDGIIYWLTPDTIQTSQNSNVYKQYYTACRDQIETNKLYFILFEVKMSF